jgi:hypothetical protein
MNCFDVTKGYLNIILKIQYVDIGEWGGRCCFLALTLTRFHNKFIADFEAKSSIFRTLNLLHRRQLVEHFGSALRIIKTPEFEIYRILPSVIHKRRPVIQCSIGFPEISLDKSAFDLPNRFSVYLLQSERSVIV